MLRKITLALLVLVGAATAAHSQSSRLSAMHRSYFVTSWSPFDSATFVYSNGRGGEGADFESRKLQHDTAYFKGYDGSGWNPYYIDNQTFDNNNNITERVKRNWKTSSGSYENADRSTFTYDANNDLVETIDGHWSTGTNSWVNDGRVERTFDANHNMLSYKFQIWNNNAWQNSNNTIYTYNSNNDMTSSKQMSWNTTTGQWDSTVQWQHFFTGNLEDSIHIFNWTSGAWQIASRFHMGYDVNSKPNFMLYQQWGGSDWVNTSQRFTTYAPQYSMDSSQTWNTMANSWENDYFYSFDFDANNRPVRYLYKKWDLANMVWLNELVDSTTYNALGQKESYKRLSWVEATQTWGGKSYDNVVKYYYENYTADVHAAKPNITDLQLYPVPAGNTLYVSAQFDAAEDFKVVVYDLQGRVLKQWGQKGVRQFYQQISVTDLAVGNYILQVRSKSGQSQQQFTIVR